MRLYCLLLLFIALAQTEGWRGRLMMKKACAVVIMASTLAGPGPALAYEAFAEDFGNTQSSAGSINLNPFASAQDIEASRAKVRQALVDQEKKAAGPKSDLDLLLEQIPSWKYYKIIGQEYSKRSAGYDGKENLLMPLM